VWEGVRAIKSARVAEPDLAEDGLLALVSGNTGVPVRLLRIPIRYWASYPGEIDTEIAAAQAAEDAAEDAWRRERDLLAGWGMSCPLLLDEMFSDTLAQQLRVKGHHVQAVVADPALASLPDDQILAHATSTRRALVTASLKDFIPLDTAYRAAGHDHAGLILVSAKTFPQDRTHTAAITSALITLLDQPAQIQPGQVLFLPRS
jgi:Domain of unknown function (DUF5615)